MQNNNLYQQYKVLSTNSFQSGDYAVIPIHGTNHKLGVSVEGYPKFFVRTNDTALSFSNIVLDKLSVEYGLSCTLKDDGTNNSASYYYTIITLRSVERFLQEDFIDIVVLMLSRIVEEPSTRDVAIEVENLISIFSAMTCPPSKKIQGLWAELLVIERSYKPEILIESWHSSPTAKYDFTLGRDKIEVKSTSGETRMHHFSLDQLRPSINSRVLIASTIVRQSGSGNGGMSVKDMYDSICRRVASADHQIYLYKVIAETLGTDIHRLNEIHFDYVEASDTLQFYDAEDVPGVDKSGVQPGVSSVGFTSDLSSVADIQSDDSTFNRELSPLFESLYK
jgi:hypothetical protein